MISRLFHPGLLACAAGLFFSVAAHAQAFRTYLSPTGFDTNPCSLAAPCRLLPAALAAVTDGGEVWILKSGNYNSGPVEITKSVTILAVPGALGSVVAKGGNAINIATPGIRVALRNLAFLPILNAGGTGGINMTAGASLAVENCLIANLAGTGITVNTAATVLVTDTTVQGNNGHGMDFRNGARATVVRSTASENAIGIRVSGQTSITTTADILDSTISGNVYGVVAVSNGPSSPVRVGVSSSNVVGNADYGLLANSVGSGARLSATGNIVSNNRTGIAAWPGGKVWLSGNAISNNGTGLLKDSTGLIESASDSDVHGNDTDTSGFIVQIGTM